MQVQIAVKGLKLVQKLDQVLETATKPVNGPRRDHVDTPGCGVLQQPVQAGALQCTAVNSLLTDSRSLFTRLGLFLLDPLRRWDDLKGQRTTERRRRRSPPALRD